jgi:hypothetical protein
VDFQVQQTGIARAFDNAFIERPGEHRREQSEHVNFHARWSSSFSLFQFNILPEQAKA